MEPDQIITMSRDSFVLKPMAPTPELALGYKKMIVFPDEWLASIAHLPVEGQEKAKADYATKKDETEEAKMTAEKREAERRVAKIFGEIQQEVNARLAAKDAAKDALKEYGRK
jgi:hypothetical protein